MYRKIRAIRSREKLLSNRAEIVATAAVLLCLGLATHPPDVGAQLVYGFLELSVRLLIVLRKLLVPSTIL